MLFSCNGEQPTEQTEVKENTEEQKTYHDNGKLQSKENYKDGKLID
ncbi:hypothetical protein OAK19_05195 [Aureispira]|nr:hypothetical protein [Aureispira sp.]